MYNRCMTLMTMIGRAGLSWDHVLGTEAVGYSWAMKLVDSPPPGTGDAP